jgi:hypothetical protein
VRQDRTVPSIKGPRHLYQLARGGDLEYKLETGDKYHRLDFGLMGGVGYRLMGGNGMNLGVRYYLGLVDITIDDTTPDQFNHLCTRRWNPHRCWKAKDKNTKDKEQNKSGQ